MKAYHSLVVFMFIVACAALSSMHSYRSAEREMVADMSQALMQTLAEKSEMTITPDTILTYRSHLRIMALREKSIVYYAMNGDEGMLSTRPMRWKNQHLTDKCCFRDTDTSHCNPLFYHFEPIITPAL